MARKIFLAGALLFLLLAAETARGQESQHVLLIGGLGGEPAYTERFASYLRETRTLLVERYGIPNDQVHVLAEQALSDRPFVDDVSTAENISAYFGRLAQRATPDDHVYVVLFGHGSFDGTHAQLNIPRRDLDDQDYAALVDELQAGRLVFINTASASGPFAAALSGPDRIVITATATGTERDETVFPRFFVEALRSPDADLDKDGGLSMREIFVYAAGQAARSFSETGHLATEHALIEDSGDGTPARADALDAANEGHLAAVTYVRAPQELAQVSEAGRTLLREKEALERSIAEMKSRKAGMDEEAYYAELESLFVRLARLNDRLEAEEQN